MAYAYGEAASDLGACGCGPRCGCDPCRRRTVSFNLGERYVSDNMNGYGFAEPKANPCAIDAAAQAIVDAAADTRVGKDKRAVAAVWAILKAYFPTSASQMSSVTYGSTIDGLQMKTDKSGQMFVGDQFLNGMTAGFFARRVLQVGHEMVHLAQYRGGWAAAQHKAVREFLAHRWVAITPALAGTGCMQHGTRGEAADCALAFYQCLNASWQKKYAQFQRDLLAVRASDWKQSGRTVPGVPTTCSTSKC
jgi:hypothetical protein